MSQAQILNQKDYKRLLAATKMTRHADRNRLAVVLSFGAGLRAKEIASVTVDNVIDASGRVKLKLHEYRRNFASSIFSHGSIYSGR